MKSIKVSIKVGKRKVVLEELSLDATCALMDLLEKHRQRLANMMEMAESCNTLLKMLRR